MFRYDLVQAVLISITIWTCNLAVGLLRMKSCFIDVNQLDWRVWVYRFQAFEHFHSQIFRIVPFL